MDKEIEKSLKSMVSERGWEKFHTLENLAKSISIESSELLEHFQWSAFPRSMQEVELELADILTYAYLMCINLKKSPEDLILKKLEITKAKYPVEKAYGKSEKYTKI